MSHNELTWDQIRAILKHGAAPTKAAMTDLLTNGDASSSPAAASEVSDPRISCAICLHPYHSPNVDGTIESPAMVACGHMFGSRCIALWLSCPLAPVNGPTCPVCRFALRFRDPSCAHVIAAVDPYSESNPPPNILHRANETPQRCLECDIDALPWHREAYRLNRLREDCEEYIMVYTNLARQHAIAGRMVAHAKNVEVVNRVTLRLKEVEEKIPQVVPKLLIEEGEYFVNGHDKRVWSKRVVTDRGEVPGGGLEESVYPDSEDENFFAAIDNEANMGI